MAIPDKTIGRLRERIQRRLTLAEDWRWAPDNPPSKLVEDDPNLFEDLLSSYSEGTSQHRSEIRKMIADMGAGSSLLLGSIMGDTSRLRETGDPKWLRSALLEFSILDSQEDPINRSNTTSSCSMIPLLSALRTATVLKR
jgi:hypothetical protein